MLHDQFPQIDLAVFQGFDRIVAKRIHEDFRLVRPLFLASPRSLFAAFTQHGKTIGYHARHRLQRDDAGLYHIRREINIQPHQSRRGAPDANLGPQAGQAQQVQPAGQRGAFLFRRAQHNGLAAVGTGVDLHGSAKFRHWPFLGQRSYSIFMAGKVGRRRPLRKTGPRQTRAQNRDIEFSGQCLFQATARITCGPPGHRRHQILSSVQPDGTNSRPWRQHVRATD